MKQALGLAATILIIATSATPAWAVQDSGVKNRACSYERIGYIRFLMQGDGSSWGPGDWSASQQWNPHTATFQWRSDYQDGSTGGGAYRVYANKNYQSLSSGCSTLG